MLRDAPRGSLQRRVETVGAVTALLLLVGITGLLAMSGIARGRLAQGTTAFVEEQRIADRISRGVMRQLALASTFSSAVGGDTRHAFLEAGEQVHGQIRQYLFRDLSAAERLQLEEMREAHQHFEVVAVQAAELFARDSEAEAASALVNMGRLGSSFLDALDQFLAMRESDLASLQSGQERIFRLLLAGGGALALGVLLGSSFLAWELSRRVTRPLAELSRATERVAAGELEARVQGADEDEFRALAESFNRMAEILQRRERELTDALAEIRATQAELVQSEKLGAIGRMSAGFAHELNNPLTSVLGYAQLMHEQLDTSASVPAEHVREHLDPILREANRARGLVRSFLQVARRPDASLRPIPLREALAVAHQLRGYAFQQAGLEFRIGDVPDVHVRGESQMLQGIFLNLTNNALDAMKDQRGGTFEIHGHLLENGRVEIVAEDDGTGLSQPDRVFEPFFTTKPVGKGTGLGLALVHQFVTAFGGQVKASNRAEGGARFVVQLVVVDPPDPQSPDATFDTDDVTLHAGSTDDVLRFRDSPEAPLTRAGRTAPTILVVEDEAHLRTLQARILGRLGARVLLAANVAEAQALLAEQAVDAVVSDVKMPGDSGVDFYHWMCERHPDLGQRFLFVTGDASAPGLDAVVTAAPHLLLRKPFRVEDYLARVRTILS